MIASPIHQKASQHGNLQNTDEHRYYKDWRGGKGKSKSKTKEKGRGKSKSVQSGHWEWHPNNKLTPKEISAILVHHAKAAEVHQRVKLSWVEIKSLGATVRHCCKPSPRHTRVNIMPECWNHKKWSFVETEGGEWQKVEECEPVDNETSFDDEKPQCCHVYLVPEWLIRVALYARMGTTSSAQQTLLLEGSNIDSWQRGAYIGRAAAAAKSLSKDVGHNGPNRHTIGSRLGKLLVVLLGQLSVSSARFLPQSAGSTTFHGDYFHVKTDKHMKSLECKMTKEENNLLLLAGQDCKEQWINDIAQMSNST